MEGVTTHGPFPPHHVRHRVMQMHWGTLTFLHWPYDPADVQRLLPPGLEVETHGGRAWVGLVPFRMMVRVPRLPEFPWLSHFPETNVRTYVQAPDGTTGVWFFSLEASRLPAVATARSAYGLPYFWARMAVHESDGVVAYRSRRRWPGPRGAATRIRIRPGLPIAADDVTEFENYLTARFRLYSVVGGVLTRSDAEHAPWPLRRAQVSALDDDLVVAAGLPAPVGDPIVHFSDGVSVRVGRPHVIRRS